MNKIAAAESRVTGGRSPDHLGTQEIAEFFKCLSEPVRLRILHLLLVRGELCVCDLVRGLDLSQSVVSRHLAYMRKNGLLSTRREGVWIYYQLSAGLAPMTDTVLQAFKQAVSGSVELGKDLTAVGCGSRCE